VRAAARLAVESEKASAVNQRPRAKPECRRLMAAQPQHARCRLGTLAAGYGGDAEAPARCNRFRR